MVDLPGNEDHDDLSSLDFSGGYGGDDGDHGSSMDALHDYAPPAEPEEAEDELEVLNTLTEPADEEVDFGPMFTVTNPQKSVTVTTLLDGRIQRVDLTDKVESMTESDLAEEIFVLADLARQKARAGQQEMVAANMAQIEAESEDQETSYLLSELVGTALNLPTPEEAAAAEAELFASRYHIEKYGD